MNKIQRLLANILLAVLATLIAFVVLEALANVYLHRLADADTFTRYASMRQLQEQRLASDPRFTPHRYLAYYPTPNYVAGPNKHNSLGYRGEEIPLPKPDGRYRIACLGGSTTYTEHIEDYRKSYPYLLEQHLKGQGYENVDVVNAGAGGWSSWETLINFELRILDLDPDLIIVYHGINDIQSRLVWPPEAYRGDNSGHRAPTLTSIFMPSLLEYSTLMRMVMIKARMTKSHAAFERTIDLVPDTYLGTQFLKQKLQGTYPTELFEKTSAAAIMERNGPIYFERNIRNVVALAKTHGIDVLLSSFAYSPLFVNRPRASSREYISAYGHNNRLVEAIAEEMDVHFFDFAEAFPAQKQWYVDGRHVTKKGARLKSKLFGEFLIDKRLVAEADD